MTTEAWIGIGAILFPSAAAAAVWAVRVSIRTQLSAMEIRLREDIARATVSGSAMDARIAVLEREVSELRTSFVELMREFLGLMRDEQEDE